MGMSLFEEIRERVKPVLFMLVFTAVTITLVSAIHLAAADAVARNANLYRQRAVMVAAGFSPPADSAQVLQWYDTWVKEENGSFLIRDPQDNRIVAKVYNLHTQGLWGRIKAMTGVTPQDKVITGLFFYEDNETPGLGARINEPWFQSQFKGKTGPFKIVPEGTRSDDPREMDAVTGATVTTSAVRDMLNQLMEEY